METARTNQCRLSKCDDRPWLSEAYKLEDSLDDNPKTNSHGKVGVEQGTLGKEVEPKRKRPLASASTSPRSVYQALHGQSEATRMVRMPSAGLGEERRGQSPKE